MLVTSTAHAADLFWDADADLSAATGGAGTWETSLPLWRLSSDTGVLQPYSNTSPSTTTAHLGGAAGTITIPAATTINVNKINVTSGGYTIASTDATSVLNLSGENPTITGTTNEGGRTYFNSKITGNSGFTLSSGSFNVFAGDLSGLTGTVNVNARATLQGIPFAPASGGGNGLLALTGSQFQEWNVTNTLTTNNHGTGSTIQLGALSGDSPTALIRGGNDNTGTTGAGKEIFQVGALNTDTTYAGQIIDNSATNTTGVSKVGTGTLTLSGTLNTSGGIVVSAGKLRLTGTSGAAGTLGALTMPGGSPSLEIDSTGTLKASSLSQGTTPSDTGVIHHTGGVFTSTGDIGIGNAGGYGVYNMTGGTLNVAGFRGGSISGGGDGSSYMHQTGGTINVSGITTLNRNGTGLSVLNIDGEGAVYNQTGGNLNPGYISGGTGVVTVSAGLLSVTNDIVLSNGGSSSVVNLNGGITRPRSIQRAADGALGLSILNFNGGILQAGADNSNFVAGLAGAYIYSGGAVIDSNGKSVTIKQPLQTPEGDGLANIAITDGGSGYLAAPVVKISGDGYGASAVATIAGGKVSGIQITSRGAGYTGETTVTLIGGGATAPATLGAITIGANAPDGGLTKKGEGTLTLSGWNSYTGATVVHEGTLRAGGYGNVFGTEAKVILDDTSGVLLDLNDNYVIIGSLSGGGAEGGNVILGMGNLTISNNEAAPVTFSGAISGPNGVLTKWGTGTQVLSGINTYSGDTYIEDGTLKLAAGGMLTFVVTDESNNKVSGYGAFVVDGSFQIDTSSVTVASGSWTLIDRSDLSSCSFGNSFSPGIGWVESSPDVWKLNEGARTWTFTEANGELVLSTGTVTYASWINGFFPGQSNPVIIGAKADPDNDGIPNAVELVIGGDPASGMDSSRSPSSEVVTNPDGLPPGKYFLFTYRRTDLSVAAGATTFCEYNTGLSGTWIPAADSIDGVKIVVDDNYASFSPPQPNTDRVRVFIPLGANPTLFGRLGAKVP